MSVVHLASIDVNLLVALDALLRERHVTRAARSIGLSQSAASHALARLRALFDDPLLVRTSSGMVPTERAEALERPLREALAGLEAVLGHETRFEPASAKLTFRIVSEDFVGAFLVPDLLASLRARAPGIDLDVVRGRPPAVYADLEAKRIDLALGVFRDPPPSIRIQRIGEGDFVCVVRKGHPKLGKRLTLKRYTELPHALIGTGARGAAPVDVALAERGLSRRIVLRIEDFLAAPLIAAETDLILTLPRALARRFATMAPLAIYEPPLPLATFPISQVWHERRQTDPAHAWMRAEIAAHTPRVSRSKRS
ncbi:MAG: LysR family transcriptional regulator [Sandaracinaceae bacterium]